jgi:hypothetical protein
MKNLLVLAALALTACAAIPPKPVAVKAGFAANDFLIVALEYAGPRELAGVNTFGPAPKSELCQRASAALIAQGHDVMPAGHTLVATCLHVKFSGPLEHGAVIMQPFVGAPLAYLKVGVEYTASGGFVGAEPLNATADAETCRNQAREIIDSTAKDGKIPAGNSLLIYCVPIPVLPQQDDVI